MRANTVRRPRPCPRPAPVLLRTWGRAQAHCDDLKHPQLFTAIGEAAIQELMDLGVVSAETARLARWACACMCAPASTRHGSGSIMTAFALCIRCRKQEEEDIIYVETDPCPVRGDAIRGRPKRRGAAFDVVMLLLGTGSHLPTAVEAVELLARGGAGMFYTNESEKASLDSALPVLKRAVRSFGGGDITVSKISTSEMTAAEVHGHLVQLVRRQSPVHPGPQSNLCAADSCAATCIAAAAATPCHDHGMPPAASACHFPAWRTWVPTA